MPATVAPLPPVALESPSATRSGRLVDRGTVRREEVRADRWSVRGVAKVTRDVDVGRADLDGLVSVAGRLSAEAVRARGALEVFGPVDVRGTFEARGDVRGGGALHAGDLDLDGPNRVDGAISVDRRAHVRGLLHAPSFDGGILEISGSATVAGELRALQVQADLSGPSEIGMVVARSVRVHGHSPNLLDKALFREARSTVARIEAESVDLANVRVGFVRATSLVLGPGAHVTAVEGNVVRRHPKSRVGPESESVPPFGLRR